MQSLTGPRFFTKAGSRIFSQGSLESCEGEDEDEEEGSEKSWLLATALPRRRRPGISVDLEGKCMRKEGGEMGPVGCRDLNQEDEEGLIWMRCNPPRLSPRTRLLDLSPNSRPPSHSTQLGTPSRSHSINVSLVEEAVVGDRVLTYPGRREEAEGSEAGQETSCND